MNKHNKFMFVKSKQYYLEPNINIKINIAQFESASLYQKQ